MLVAVDSWCSMCPYCPRAMLGAQTESKTREESTVCERKVDVRARFGALWKKCSHENANNILFAWRIVLEGASDASTLPMWRVE